jgi:hypothetical protein
MTPDLKPRFPGKKLVMVITHDDPESDDMAALLEEQLKSVFVDKLGYDVIGVINYRCGRNSSSAREDPEVIMQARELGRLL